MNPKAPRAPKMVHTTIIHHSAPAAPAPKANRGIPTHQERYEPGEAGIGPHSEASEPGEGQDAALAALAQKMAAMGMSPEQIATKLHELMSGSTMPQAPSMQGPPGGDSQIASQLAGMGR